MNVGFVNNLNALILSFLFWCLSFLSFRQKFLKAATVAHFRGLYPRLDPYACKGAYDFWIEGLPPERKPRHYDAVFKKFAEKWVVGKLIVSNP